MPNTVLDNLSDFLADPANDERAYVVVVSTAFISGALFALGHLLMRLAR